MSRIKPLNINKIWIRILIVLILSIVIWQFTDYLTEVLFSEEYSQINQLFIAVITTVLSIILIQEAFKFDKFHWHIFGMGAFKTNITSFLLGFFLWIIPAAVGLFICVIAGWVEIKAWENIPRLF